MLIKGITAVSLIFAVVFYLTAKPALWLAVLVFAAAFLLLAGLSFAFLWISCRKVDMDQPQEEDSPFYRAMMHLYIEALIMLVGARIQTQGLEKTPKDGRFLLVCNHLFIADPGVLLHCFKKSQLAFITKQENQELPIIAPIMHKILCQPIDRDNDRAALKTILKCIQILKEDKASICVFPEGYTSKDGKLHHFRSGVFKIALKTQVPIVVCTLYGTQNVLKNAMRLKPSEVDFHLVKVIYPEDYAGMTATEVGNMAYELMAQDLGPDKVWQKPENMEETE